MWVATSHMSLRASLLATRILSAQPRLRPQHLEALLTMTNSIEATAARMRAMANIVESHCAAGRRQDAFRFLQEHRPRAIEPFEPLLVACVMGGDDTALRLATRIMREAGVTPTASTFGLLLSARLDCGDTARALKVCQGALAAGLAPPPENVRALVLALAEAGLSGSALELLAALRERHGRLMPHERSNPAIHALLEGAARAHDMPLESLAVWDELKHHVDAAAAGQLSDDLLKRCVRAGNLRAFRALHRQLHLEGATLRHESLELVLRDCLDRGELQEALKLWDEQASRHQKDAFPWPSLRWTAVEHGNEGHSLPELVALDELDLSAVSEGVACVGAIRFFQRLAALALSESPKLPLPSQVLLRTQTAHVDALVRTAASLAPPLQLRLQNSSTDSLHDEVGLLVDAQELDNWARQIRDERSRGQRTNQFVAVAAGHNALWTFALLGSGWMV